MPMLPVDGEDFFDDTIDENSAKQTAPRRIQHYKFAHEILRDYFFKDRNTLLDSLLSSEDILRSFWTDVGKYYAENFEGVEELDGSEIRISHMEYSDTHFVIIQLPQPEQSPEAYFIGLILPHNNEGDGRYITLEYGDDEEVGKYTVLCEWNREAHRNFGVGCHPTKKDFQDTLIALVDETRSNK